MIQNTAVITPKRIVKKLTNKLYRNLLRHGLYSAAEYIDEKVRLNKEIILNRAKSTFDLVIHLKSVRRSKYYPGEKPLCDCLICKNKYKSYLNKKAYKEIMLIIRNIEEYEKKEELLLALPYMSPEKKDRILRVYKDKLPVLRTMPPQIFKIKLSRIAYKCKQRADNHDLHVQTLKNVLAVPNI